MLRITMVLILTLAAVAARAEQPGGEELQSVLRRLERLEEQNRALSDEVKQLRAEVSRMSASSAAPVTPGAGAGAAPGEDPQTAAPTVEERLDVAEHRIDEQAQSKVGTAQKLPVTLTGMILFNSFLGAGPAIPGASYNHSPLLQDQQNSGATLRQSIVGLSFDGPEILNGGKVTGLVEMDFFGNYAAPDNYAPRLRRGELSIDWADRGLMVGQDKPLISPRQPFSLAEVGTPPLDGSGNLWLWLPQVRYEERHKLGEDSGIKAQVALLETDESYGYYSQSASDYAPEPSRPAIEGRVEYWHNWGDGLRLEVAPGFHLSTTHAAGVSIPSRIASLDWLIRPLRWFEDSGTFFTGENFAPIGGLGGSYTVGWYGSARPVRGTGGWNQFSFPVTRRLTFNLWGGWQANTARDLSLSGVLTDYTYAGNAVYRLGSNVLVSAEALQNRILLVPRGHLIENHYDVAIGYLF